MLAFYQQVYNTLTMASDPGPAFSYLSMTGLKASFIYYTNIIILG